jgi:hypothetical protein
MASPLNAALCALVATALWTLLGYALSRRLLPGALAAGAAPVAGWSVHSAVALPLFTLTGFTAPIVIVAVAIFAISAFVSLKLAAKTGAEKLPTIPLWVFSVAAVLALAPAVAILPKISGDSVYLADPIFDHAKIAMQWRGRVCRLLIRYSAR